MRDYGLDYLKRWIPKPAITAAASGASRLMHGWRPGADPLGFYPNGLRQRLASFPITHEIGDRALNALLANAQWFSLPGGTLLAREGDNDQAVFIVVTGGLGVFTEDDSGEDHFVANLRARRSAKCRLSPATLTPRNWWRSATVNFCASPSRTSSACSRAIRGFR
jgi:hypothetical protein